MGSECDCTRKCKTQDSDLPRGVVAVVFIDVGKKEQGTHSASWIHHLENTARLFQICGVL